jgi:hypothetical protein
MPPSSASSRDARAVSPPQALDQSLPERAMLSSSMRNSGLGETTPASAARTATSRTLLVLTNPGDLSHRLIAAHHQEPTASSPSTLRHGGQHYFSVMCRPKHSLLRLYCMEKPRRAEERYASQRKDAAEPARHVGKGLRQRMDCVLAEQLPEHIARLLAKLKDTDR